MDRQEHLEAILECTVFINSGLKTGDMDIVLNALEKRAGLISSYGYGKFDSSETAGQKLVKQIHIIDKENKKLLSQSMKQCSGKMGEIRYRIMELENGKKATTQYQNPIGFRGAVFDLKS